MPRPNIEILRAKLALMSPNECPSAAIAAARNNFPDALEILWIMPTTSVANSKSTRSSSVTIASIGGDGLTPMSDTGPQLPAPPTVARDAVAGLPAPTPSAINSRAVNENVNINAGLNSVFEVDMPDRSPTIQRNAENFVANNTQLNVPSFANNAQLNARAFVSNSQIIVKYPTVNEAQSKAEAEAIAAYRGGSGRLPQFIVNLCNSIKIPSHIARKRSKVSTRPLRNDSYYTDSYENGNKNGRANGGINSSTGNVKKDHASKSTPAGNQKGKNIQGSAKRLKKNSDQVDVIIISDDSDDEVEMIDATEGFEPRYVVVDIVGWVFREVATANKAVRMCAQVMPPIHAGNGVRLYINDRVHDHVLKAFRKRTFLANHRKNMTGSSRNRALIRRQREMLQDWRAERGYVRSLEDIKWDFSPLWYLFKNRIEELKKKEKEMRCSAGGVTAAEDAVAEGQRKKSRDLAWLRFEDGDDDGDE